jgi:hypothetical protein
LPAAKVIRPYVRLPERQHAPHTAEEPLGGASPSAGQPKAGGRHARTPADIRLTRAVARADTAPAPAARPVNRVRWRFLAVGSGVLMLALAATVLALSVGDRPAAPAPGAAGSTTPRGGLLETALVPAPEASPASNTPATAGASSVSEERPLPGVSSNQSDAAPPSGSPASMATPARAALVGACKHQATSSVCRTATADRPSSGCQDPRTH